jgi:RNA polymerase sigma-70 factor (ECF subfamily)
VIVVTPKTHQPAGEFHSPDLEPNGSTVRLCRQPRMAISKEAFEAEVLAMLGPLQGVARRLTRNDADAEDLVSETIVRAWRSRDSLSQAGAFRAWMFRILNNTFISERRKALARPYEQAFAESDRWEGEPSFSTFEQLHQPFLLWFANPEQEFLEKLRREQIDRALAELPEHYRVVVVLADLEELRYSEIAETLEIPIGTVRSRLARARSALQASLWQLARDCR